MEQSSMWSTVFEREVLRLRDERQGLIDTFCGTLTRDSGGALIVTTANAPGFPKNQPTLIPIFAQLMRRLPEIHAAVVHRSSNDLGPIVIAKTYETPLRTKRWAVELETQLRGGRLLDLDVYTPDARAIGRTDLGLEPRPCWVCGRSAVDCIRLRCHSLLESLHAFERQALEAQTISAVDFAEDLYRASRDELDFTPKPGLVDRDDPGSHPDLSYAMMERSTRLLPPYLDEIVRIGRTNAPLHVAVNLGRQVEARMVSQAGSNTHNGYVFLSALTLLAVLRCNGEIEKVRSNVADLSAQYFTHFAPETTAGARLRESHNVGGIRSLALSGLSPVLEDIWPRYRVWKRRQPDTFLAQAFLLGHLMAQVEDTTSIRRCGLSGLARVRRDGETLLELLESGRNPLEFLRRSNDEYRGLNLTMGGVADCFALVLAFDRSVNRRTEDGLA